MEKDNYGIEGNEHFDADERLRRLAQSVLDKLNNATTLNDIESAFFALRKEASDLQQQFEEVNPGQEALHIELPFGEGESIEISDLETKVVNLHGAMSGHDEKEIAELSVGVPAEVIDIVNYLTQDAKLELADRWKSIMK
jgi:superfamily I DNA and/or RNA helicase